jgi:hypothetical protein
LPVLTKSDGEIRMIFRYDNKIWLSDLLKIILLSAILTLISKVLQINIGIDFMDEGYLWYGVKQTLNGYIPIHDFNSYDIARYYWCAFWSYVFGSEIIGLRISISLFQFIGLCCALYVVRKTTSNWVITLIAGIILSMWMFPRHKLFEISLSLACIFFGFTILEYRSRKWILISGVFVGIAALFGRNHGLYSFLALTIIICYVLLKARSKTKLNFLKEYSYFLMGVVIGYSPMLIMFLIIPDFFEFYLHNKVFIFFQREATNLRLPIPWFWAIDYSKQNVLGSIYYFIQGLLFFIIPIYYLFVFFVVFFRRSIFQEKIYHGLIASGVVGFFYMHHIFARASLSHLAQGIFPFFISLILIVNFINKKVKIVMFIFIIAISLFSVGQRQPYYNKLFKSNRLTSYTVNGDKLWIYKHQAKIIDTIQKINSKVPKDEGLLIAPHLPIFYPILNKTCPIYNSFLLFPEDKQNQLKMVEDLKNKRVNWIILGNNKLDGRDDLLFRNTHELLFDYILNNYEAINIVELPNNYNLYHKKG